MRIYHFIFLAIIFLACVVVSGTVRQYLTFLPQY